MNGLQMKYFVLKPTGNNSYATASRRAMLEYAKVIRDTNSELADELRSWAHRTMVDAYK